MWGWCRINTRDIEGSICLPTSMFFNVQTTSASLDASWVPDYCVERFCLGNNPVDLPKQVLWTILGDLQNS